MKILSLSTHTLCIEILKINNYKAPRDKLICILNCCKVIFGLIKHVEGDAGADKFLPILIYVVIRANPPRLVSNVQQVFLFLCYSLLFFLIRTIDTSIVFEILNNCKQNPVII